MSRPFIAVPLTEAEIRDKADILTPLLAESSFDEREINGTSYLLFSKETLHNVVEAVIRDLNSQEEN